MATHLPDRTEHHSPKPEGTSATVATSDDVRVTTPAKVCGMGHRMKRKEDPRFIQGKGRYVDDVKLPNMVYMDLVRSPYAHAKITKIDTSAALATPGVLHLDAYRLPSAADLVALGFGELDTVGRPVVIEWGSRAADALPRERLTVTLSHEERGRGAHELVEVRVARVRHTSLVVAAAAERVVAPRQRARAVVEVRRRTARLARRQPRTTDDHDRRLTVAQPLGNHLGKVGAHGDRVDVLEYAGLAEGVDKAIVDTARCVRGIDPAV